MRKYAVIPLLLMVCIGLTGCGSKTLSCTKEDNSNEDLKMTNKIEAKFSKDKITKMVTVVEVKADGIYKKHVDSLKKSLEEQFTDVKDKKGVTFKTDVKDNTISLRLDVNVKEMDADSLEELNIMETTQKYEDAKKSLEKDGYTCK